MDNYTGDEYLKQFGLKFGDTVIDRENRNIGTLYKIIDHEEYTTTNFNYYEVILKRNKYSNFEGMYFNMGYSGRYLDLSFLKKATEAELVLYG